MGLTLLLCSSSSSSSSSRSSSSCSSSNSSRNSRITKAFFFFIYTSINLYIHFYHYSHSINVCDNVTLAVRENGVRGCVQPLIRVHRGAVPHQIPLLGRRAVEHDGQDRQHLLTLHQ